MFKWNVFPAHNIPIFFYGQRIGRIVTTRIDVLKNDVEENRRLVGRGIKFTEV